MCIAEHGLDVLVIASSSQRQCFLEGTFNTNFVPFCRSFRVHLDAVQECNGRQITVVSYGTTLEFIKQGEYEIKVVLRWKIGRRMKNIGTSARYNVT